MKNILFLLLCILITSCTSQKVLKTDTQQDIDLSGRWNNTDAEIASGELFNSLLTSPWLKDFEMKNERKARIQVLSFSSNFDADLDNIENFFKQYIKSASLFELVPLKSKKSPDFFVLGELKAQEFISANEKYIDYKLLAVLKDSKELTQWEDSTLIKKYIKD